MNQPARVAVLVARQWDNVGVSSYLNSAANLRERLETPLAVGARMVVDAVVEARQVECGHDNSDASGKALERLFLEEVSCLLQCFPAQTVHCPSRKRHSTSSCDAPESNSAASRSRQIHRAVPRLTTRPWTFSGSRHRCPPLQFPSPMPLAAN